MDAKKRRELDRERELNDLAEHLQRCWLKYGREFVMDGLVDAIQAIPGAIYPKAIYAFVSSMGYKLGRGDFDSRFPGNNAMGTDKGKDQGS